MKRHARCKIKTSFSANFHLLLLSEGSLSLQVEVVGSCSVLELFMLVAIYRIKRRGHDSANFEMVHDEYCKLLDQGGTGDRRSKTAALRAFEHLIASSLVSYVDGRWTWLTTA